MTAFYAHTKSDADGCLLDTSEWEPLFSEDCETLRNEPCEQCQSLAPQHGHLNKVAYLAGKFAGEMFADGPDRESARQWGFLAGLWHDLGKFSEAFQRRIRGEGNKANHSTAGGQLAEEVLDPLGLLLAYPMLGHHAGLADFQGDPSSLIARLVESPYLKQLTDNFPSISELLVEPFTQPASIPCAKDPQSCAFFTKLLFSCLVDSDFLATEKFCDPPKASLRPDWNTDILDQMHSALTAHLKAFPDPEPGSINEARAQILADCTAAAGKLPGFHTLTVPTGGGKTFSSLAFALKHALANNLRRIIYVIPFTSIIEQNAQIFGEVFAELSKTIGHPVVLEHHSNFDPSTQLEDDDIPIHKLSGENWDSPLIVTTNVQFFESLAHHKTSRCRKLHNIARSVLIFDEAQAFPPDHLTACLGFLKELVAQAHSSVVLCSATQPAFRELPDDQPGDFTKSFNQIALPLKGEKTEIIPDVPALFSIFKRTQLHLASEPISDKELVHRIASTERSLTILNTKPHASKIFEDLSAFDQENDSNLHLSAQLAPAHRQVIIADIHRREKNKLPCRLVSTTVVEAGVNISFPILFRCLSGLDSLAQSLGRCNRHRELFGPDGNPIPGEAYFFTSADQKTPDFLKYAVNATHNVLEDPYYRENPDELLNPPAIETYFRHAYWQHGGLNGDGWDKPDYRGCFKHDSKGLPFLLNYRSFSKQFRLIPDIQEPVIIEPHADYMPGLTASDYEKIPLILEAIREADTKKFPPPLDVHRILQRFTVQIPKPIHRALVKSADIQLYCDGRFPILTHPQSLYDPKLGLNIPYFLVPRADQLWYL